MATIFSRQTKASNKLARILIALLATIVLILVSVIIGYGYQFFYRPLPIDKPITYIIPPKTSLYSVAYDLKRKQIIARPKHLIWYAEYFKLAKKVKAGEYVLQSG